MTYYVPNLKEWADEWLKCYQVDGVDEDVIIEAIKNQLPSNTSDTILCTVEQLINAQVTLQNGQLYNTYTIFISDLYNDYSQYYQYYQTIDEVEQNNNIIGHLGNVTPVFNLIESICDPQAPSCECDDVEICPTEYPCPEDCFDYEYICDFDNDCPNDGDGPGECEDWGGACWDKE